MNTKPDRLNLAKRLLPSLQKRIRWVIWTLGMIVALPASIVFAEYCWQYVDLFQANNPKPWECSAPPPSGADPLTLATQKIIDEHFNWHCVNGHIGTAPGLGTGPGFFDPGYGRAFLALHKQMINDFDVVREDLLGLPRIEVWDPNPLPDSDPNYNPMPFGIPGNPQAGFPGSGVSDAAAGAIAGGDCAVGTGRSGDGVTPSTYTRCPLCQVLPSQFRAPPFGTLDTYTNADALGIDLDLGSGWHASFHTGISAATDANDNRCDDINPPRTSPRDAMFWRAHAALDDVHASWQRLAAADIMIVLDRSGSMAGPSETGSVVTKMNAAKSAAEMFADLLEDGQGHNLGLVSFSTSATSPPDLGLTSVDGILPTVQATLAGISPGGNTAIGDGLLEAQAALTTGGNDRKAILLLTDGKENEPPCLDGTGFLCLGSGSDIAADAFGDTQICTIGYGDDSGLDAIVLRDLAERQGGIYTSGIGDLQLKKFFVDCFADIFDEFPAMDPFGVLPAQVEATEPLVVPSSLDTKITFVLAWENRGDPLRLEITTPSGELLDLSDPTIENSSGPTWHFVRVPLPYGDEKPGDWRVRGVRVDLPGRDQPYFINVLVSGAARVDPINVHFHHYTGDPFFPAARIMAPYRPLDEFDKVDAFVRLTRPLEGTGNIMTEIELGQSGQFFGDHVDARTMRLQEYAEEIGEEFIPTETEIYRLYDDGTNGDRFANNHYWSTQLPQLAAVEGHYQLRFVFDITEGEHTFHRESNLSIYVEVKIDPEATEVEIEPLGPGEDGRERTRFAFVPMDSLGNFLGPGRAKLFDVLTAGDARIEGEVEDNGKGGYAVIVSWVKEEGEPTLILKQNGQTRQTLNLATGELTLGMPAVDDIFHEHLDPPPPSPLQPTVQRQVSNSMPKAGETVMVTLMPSGFETYNYTVEEMPGGLQFTGEHTADQNPQGTTFEMMKPMSFSYQVQIPADAAPGTQFTISGQFWNDPAAEVNRQPVGDTVLTVLGDVYLPFVTR